MYEHRYKYGKQKDIMTVEEFRELLEKSTVPLPHKAYCVLLWHTGVRKSEAYELLKSKVQVTEEYVIVDFGVRKKHGEEAPPVRIPIGYYGMTEVFLPYLASLSKREKLLFPMIRSTTAWKIVKRILGPKYYPHYFRLRKLSAAGSSGKIGLTQLKSFSGIKSTTALGAYLGLSQKGSDEAMRASE